MAKIILKYRLKRKMANDRILKKQSLVEARAASKPGEIRENGEELRQYSDTGDERSVLQRRIRLKSNKLKI